MSTDNGDLNPPSNSGPSTSSKGDKFLKAPSDDVGSGADTSSRPVPVPKLGEQENVGDHSQTMRRVFIGPMPRKRVVDETGDLDDSNYKPVAIDSNRKVIYPCGLIANSIFNGAVRPTTRSM